MTDINCDVPTARAVTAGPWHARPGAFSPRSAFPGTGVSGVGIGTVSISTVSISTGPSSPVRPVPHVRDKAAALPLAAPMAQLGQTNNYIQMTSVFVSGEGASGPPPDREPA